MRIVLLCATQRGLKFLETLRTLCPDDDITVFSFREVPWEPKFVDDIRAFSERHDLRFFETRDAADKEYEEIWKTPIDLVFVVHWRYMLPMALMDHVRLGAVVLHDSLLPAYRGFSPTVWAIINGEDYCGASMFFLAKGMDTGDIIDQVRVAIGPEETIAEVMDKVTLAYETLLKRNIKLLKAAQALRIPQDQSLATHVCRRTPEDNLIDWQQPTRLIHNLIRAVTHPYTGAYTFYMGAKMIIWSAKPCLLTQRYGDMIPGNVIEVKPDEGAIVATGDGSLLICTVQIEGGSEVCASDIVKGVTNQVG